MLNPKYNNTFSGLLEYPDLFKTIVEATGDVDTSRTVPRFWTRSNEVVSNISLLDITIPNVSGRGECLIDWEYLLTVKAGQRILAPDLFLPGEKPLNVYGRPSDYSAIPELAQSILEIGLQTRTEVSIWQGLPPESQDTRHWYPDGQGSTNKKPISGNLLLTGGTCRTLAFYLCLLQPELQERVVKKHGSLKAFWQKNFRAEVKKLSPNDLSDVALATKVYYSNKVTPDPLSRVTLLYACWQASAKDEDAKRQICTEHFPQYGGNITLPKKHLEASIAIASDWRLMEMLVREELSYNTVFQTAIAAGEMAANEGKALSEVYKGVIASSETANPTNGMKKPSTSAFVETFFSGEMSEIVDEQRVATIETGEPFNEKELREKVLKDLLSEASKNKGRVSVNGLKATLREVKESKKSEKSDKKEVSSGHWVDRELFEGAVSYRDLVTLLTTLLASGKSHYLKDSRGNEIECVQISIRKEYARAITRLESAMPDLPDEKPRSTKK